MKQVSYQIVEETPTHILIRDIGPWDKYLSVTNGAEIVVEELAGRLNGRRLFYIDTEGLTDELLVQDGQFAGFKAGPRGDEDLP